MSRKLGIFENVTIIVAMVLLDLFVAAPATTAAARKCPAGQFLPPDSLLNECRRCSSCPDNEIIRKPCSEERDTECGPFYEFRDFNSFQPGEAELDIGVGQYPKNRATGSPELEDFKNEFSEDSTSESKDGISAKGQKAPSVQTGQEHWKELCYGLIAALVIVTLCAVLYVVISQVLRRRRLRKNASPLHNDADVTVYYRTDGHAEEHHQYPHHSRYQPPARAYKPSLVHIESQLEHNQRYRRFWQRFLRPGSVQILGGNEYVVTADNLHNQEMQDQRRLLPMNIVPEDNAQMPLAHAHQEDNLPLPEGAGGANISLHSTDSGIVAGLGDHPHTSCA